MSEQNNGNEPISDQYLEKLRLQVRPLIIRFCKIEGLDDGRQRLFLHNEEEIKFTKHKPDDIAIFYELVKKHRNYFLYLIQHLSHESETQKVETDHITGTIDFQKTWALNQTGSTKLVCITYEKNIFTPENVMLGYIILSINSVADKFLSRRDEWDKDYVLDDYVKMLHDVKAFVSFLQKDRFVSKLMNYYYRNFDSYEFLLKKISYRMRLGKIRPQYKPLIEFIRVWRSLDKILVEPSSLEVELSIYLNKLTEDRLYEYYIFYKILQSIPNMKQKPHPHEFSNSKYTVEYQFRKYIEWEKDGTELYRIPDTVIKKDGEIIAMFDAKYMKSGDKLETEKLDDPPDMPDRSIVNQMIIAMDYGKPRDKTDIGIVLFADARYQSTVVIEKGPKKIHFLNMHPANNPENALAEVKNIIGVK